MSVTGSNDGVGALDQLSPKLVQTQEVSGNPQTQTTINRREFTPVVVTRLGGTLPWDTNSTQLQCGETVTDNSGDLNIRLVYHCVATHTQFQTLKQMRSASQSIKLVSRAYSGPVTFDEMKFDRIPDANGAVIRGEGETREPLYEIQLQSKEDSEDSEDNVIGGNG